ncbi:hypothetical protein FRC11_008852 [Ceratobasidium sp. 423]|nr:hypothetical protein FRC11_008852 [Ceratobasidium sp. 423]
MTGALPYANKKEYTIPLEVVMKRNTPARPDFNGILACETAKHALWHLLTRCWSYAPEGRPTATEVKEKALLIFRKK